MSSQRAKHAEVTSLAGQWLNFPPFNAKGMGVIPGWGAKILQASQCSWEKKKNLSKLPQLVRGWEAGQGPSGQCSDPGSPCAEPPLLGSPSSVLAFSLLTPLLPPFAVSQTDSARGERQLPPSCHYLPSCQCLFCVLDIWGQKLRDPGLQHSGSSEELPEAGERGVGTKEGCRLCRRKAGRATPSAWGLPLIWGRGGLSMSMALTKHLSETFISQTSVVIISSL